MTIQIALFTLIMLVMVAVVALSQELKKMGKKDDKEMFKKIVEVSKIISPLFLFISLAFLLRVLIKWNHWYETPHSTLILLLGVGVIFKLSYLYSYDVMKKLVYGYIPGFKHVFEMMYKMTKKFEKILGLSACIVLMLYIIYLF